MPKHVTFEVCIDRPDSLSAAIAGGADRIELCAALGLGGLTPSAGLINAAANSNIPCHAMIRPRAGDFVLRSGDLDAMLADIAAVKQAGLAGVVLGVSRENGELDANALQTLVDAADGMQTTLHRAFDLTPDAEAALETAIELGFDRVLTSGQAPAAPAGTGVLAQLVTIAANRIEIMAGGGVTVVNVPDLIATGVDGIHSSCSTPDPDHADCGHIGIAPARICDAQSVAAMKTAIIDGARAA